jgi:hypothetical protein
MTVSCWLCTARKTSPPGQRVGYAPIGQGNKHSHYQMSSVRIAIGGGGRAFAGASCDRKARFAALSMMPAYVQRSAQGLSGDRRMLQSPPGQGSDCAQQEQVLNAGCSFKTDQPTWKTGVSDYLPFYWPVKV